MALYFKIDRIVDCEWNAWTIDSCNASCGGGSLTKQRTINISAAHGGKECVGDSSVDEDCNTETCSGKKYEF